MVRKDFLLRAKQKGVDVDTGIVTGKLNKKRLDPRTKAEYQNRLDQWDRFVQEERPNARFNDVESLQAFGSRGMEVWRVDMFEEFTRRVGVSMPCSVKVLVGKDDMRDYRGARVKRTTITAIECVSADGRFLNPMIIWPASTHRSNWTTYPTPGWQYACSESGYTDSTISLEWLKRIFDPETKERANQKPRVLICDGFGTHETLEILEYCFENNIILCRLPSHTSHKLQPCDVAVFAPLKAAYRDQIDRLERAGTNTIGKEHFTSLYSPARERALTKKNILAGWLKCGLEPLDPDRVLKDTPKPPAELTNPKADEVKVRSCPQDDVLQTPVTPVSAEALMSLQNFIIKKYAYALDETSKRSLVRHLQKLTNAAQTPFAKGVLQQHQIRFLIKMNDESKVRRSTTSVVLGKAKVLSYADLVEARAKRAEKEAPKHETHIGTSSC